ncbi:MAG TPA: 50S ribosomal protein L29 [Deltaproteobacteria bacterium]|nr:MAG: 50S ribosomal protein L29 [Deltaproteobacteria bacterium GWA2_55_82]OGQ65173.1 MAG: 50S ribosomal protein L29 [Deltaproteobacteria bacterium RIFCSPLOWO2_02_FULL_55_12]OIJ74701.1 MAG: 50S ribosomal protein L29 [Deltaproteobacteria bacterium GWC2_55_46]HBG45623.1 50S ribosomal protein L29 [Deltaproteobacteria bacterium]HCY12184.1 50S ribosomal protein L29 [Deltaproteobacteria bacterium]
MKPAEIRGMTLEDLKAKGSELEKELFSLRMRHATSQLENPLRLRALRRDIARMRTIAAEKERGKK